MASHKFLSPEDRKRFDLRTSEGDDGLTLTVLGCGTLGIAILSGILSSLSDQRSAEASGTATPLEDIPPRTFSKFIACVTRSASVKRVDKALSHLTSSLSVFKSENIKGAKAADVIILGCKPYNLSTVLQEEGMKEALAGKLLISILAGVPVSQIEDTLYGAGSSEKLPSDPAEDGRCRVVRAMPNTAALIRESMTVIALSNPPLPADLLSLVTWMFTRVGRVVTLPANQMDACTALCGSGPATFALVLEAIADGAVAMGLPRAEAQLMAAQTMRGTSGLVLNGEHPAMVREKAKSAQLADGDLLLGRAFNPTKKRSAALVATKSTISPALRPSALSGLEVKAVTLYLRLSRWAHNLTVTMAAGSTTGLLPPSVEEAYRRKCIELKKRIAEIEESSDAFRTRKVRLNRGIRKMRLERAYLLECLGNRMKKNGRGPDGLPGFYDEDSDGSSEAPPTPEEKPLRSKRSARRPLNSTPPPVDDQGNESQSMNRKSFDRGSQSRGGPNGSVHAGQNGQAARSSVENSWYSREAQDGEQQDALEPESISAPDAFAMFFENNYLSQPHKHPGHRTEDDLHDLAREHWESPDFAGQRRMFEKQADKQRQRFHEPRQGLDERPDPEQEALQHEDRGAATTTERLPESDHSERRTLEGPMADREDIEMGNTSGANFAGSS